MKMRRGVIMMEIAIGMAVLLVIAMIHTLKTYHQKEHMAFDTTLTDVIGILDYGVFNTETGYMSGVGGYCSNGVNVNNISVARVMKCADLNASYNVVSVGDEMDGRNSYVHFMESHSNSGDGCNFYFDDISPDEMYVYMECDIPTNERAEHFFVTGLKNALKDKYVQADYESISLETDTGGTDNDGRARIMLKR